MWLTVRKSTKLHTLNTIFSWGSPCGVLSSHKRKWCLGILLAERSRGWKGGSFSVPAPPCSMSKQLSSFTLLMLSKENRVQVGRWKILLCSFMHQHWDLSCFDHGSATSRIAGQTQYPFLKMGWKHAVGKAFLFPCCLHPHQTQFFMAPGNGFSDCHVCRLTTRLVAAAKALHTDKEWSLLPGSSNRGCCTWTGRWLEAPCPSAEQGKKQRQKERKQSGRSEEKQQRTTKANGWLPAPVGMCYSLKHFRSSFPEAAHQGTGWGWHRARAQVSSSPSAQVSSSAGPRVTAPAVSLQSPRLPAKGAQPGVATLADVWHCLWEVLLGSTSITKTVTELPTLQHPTFLLELSHLFFQAQYNL